MLLLTGPSGAGKSTLAGLLEREGWGRLDGDALAKSLYVPGSPLMRRLARTFGPGVLRPDGSLDAAALGAQVFSSASKRKALRRLVYGPFLRLLRARLARARAQGGKWVVEVAVYFDMGAPKLGLPVALVRAPQAVRVRRLRSLGLSASRARGRASSLRFGPRERRRSDLVLDGTLPRAALLKEFRRGLLRLQASASRVPIRRSVAGPRRRGLLRLGVRP